MISSPLNELGDYTIEAELGRGGMGVVYLATHRGLGRHVALKVMNPSLAQDPEFVDRFSREATTLAKVDSPHIIAVYDHGRVGDVLYLATQYVDGGDLSTMIRTLGPLPVPVCLELFTQILKGLRDAHRAGVIHRDVKPANILLRSDQSEPHVYLCDFGIAQQDGADQYTRTGTVVGSTAFLAPERAAGRPASVRSDLYSAACVLWVMLSGRNLYEGTDFQVASQHASGPIPQLQGTGAATEAINVALRACLAKSPEQRPASADEMLHRIAGVQDLTRPRAVADRFVPVMLPAPDLPADTVSATRLRPTPPSAAPAAFMTADAPAPSRRRVGLVLALTAGVLVLGLGVFALSRMLSSQSAASPVASAGVATQTTLPAAPPSTPTAPAASDHPGAFTVLSLDQISDLLRSDTLAALGGGSFTRGQYPKQTARDGDTAACWTLNSLINRYALNRYDGAQDLTLYSWGATPLSKPEWVESLATCSRDRGRLTSITKTVYSIVETFPDHYVFTYGSTQLRVPRAATPNGFDPEEFMLDYAATVDAIVG